MTPLAMHLRFSPSTRTEEGFVKRIIAVGVLMGLASSPAWAQGTDIHSLIGPTGTHFNLPVNSQSFNYQVTITGATSGIRVKLWVYRNGVEKVYYPQLFPSPSNPQPFSYLVSMVGWGLTVGDTITFVCKVYDLNSGVQLASHTLYGDVVSP